MTPPYGVAASLVSSTSRIGWPAKLQLSITTQVRTEPDPAAVRAFLSRAKPLDTGIRTADALPHPELAAGEKQKLEIIKQLYLGRSFDYKPLDLPEGTGLHDTFYKRATDRDYSQVKALWARLVFTGHAQPPKVLADAAAVKKAVAADPKSVGYIDSDDLDSSVKAVLTLN